MFKIETIVDSCNECPYLMYEDGMCSQYYCDKTQLEVLPQDRYIIQEWCPYTQQEDKAS